VCVGHEWPRHRKVKQNSFDMQRININLWNDVMYLFHERFISSCKETISIFKMQVYEQIEEVL
jgi:hypothetical protein